MKRNVRPLQAFLIVLTSLNIKKENLTIELTALKLFGKEQFYIRRYEDMTTRRYENTQEPQNRKSISSLKEEIDFF